MSKTDLKNLDGHIKVELVLPNIPEYISLARYSASVMANSANLNIDEIEDIRVALSEACANAIQYGCETCDYYEVVMELQEGELLITVTDHGQGYDYKQVKEPVIGEQVGGFGLYLIRSLMDNLEIDSNIGEGTTVKIHKLLRESNGTEKSTK